MATASIELEVQVTKRVLVKASHLSEPTSILSLSNFDLISGNHPATLVHIYPPPPRNNRDHHHHHLPSSITSVIKTNLPQFLNHFFPFTGRITTNPATNKPQVLCNNDGAELVEARANARLSDIDFHHKSKSLDAIVLPYGPDIALCVQVVHFSCGGFSVAWSTNHMLADAAGLSQLSCSWADFVRTGKMARVPEFDRSVLIQPPPPRVISPALDRSYITVTSGDMINVLSAAGMLSDGVYYVESSGLVRLQSLASRTSARKSTRMRAFSAHVWKVLANVVGESAADATCRLGWFVDGRRSMGAGGGYMGNVFSCATGEARVQDLIREPLPLVAEKVEASIAEFANRDHFLDLMELVERRRTAAVPVAHHAHTLLNRINLGLGSPAIVLSSCHHLPVESEFGFGEAALSAFHSTGCQRLGAGFMQIAPSAKGDGAWVVSARLWPKVARALESDLICALKPLTAEYLGLHRPINNLRSTTTSRL